MPAVAALVLFLIPGCGSGTDPAGGPAPTGAPATLDASAPSTAAPTAATTPSSPPTTVPAVDEAVADHTVVATATVSRVVAHQAPDPASPEVGRFANPIPSGAPLVFEVRSQQGGWVEVSLPVRPNGTTGWIAAGTVALSRNRFRIEVDVSDHHLLVHDADQVVVDTPVGIGTGATPTPIGSFYLIELLAPADPSGLYGPYAFGLSGYSETLASFNGGEGVIGIHGTNDPTSIGRDSSHGCIRVPNDTITYMASILPLGTPVVITP